MDEQRFAAPTHELRADCGELDEAAQDPHCFSSVIALADGTVIASEIDAPFVQAIGNRRVCRTKIGCTAFLFSAPDTVWCVYEALAPHALHNERFGIAYSTDEGMTWSDVAVVPPYLLRSVAVGLPAADGFMMGDDDGRLWRVERRPSDHSIAVRALGSNVLGWGRGSGHAFLFGPESACAEIRRDSDPPADFDAGTMFCRRTGEAAWQEIGPAEIARAASSRRAWWTLNSSGHLFVSPFDPRAWREVRDDAFDSIRIISPDGSGSGVVGVAKRGGAELVVRIDARGDVVERIPTGFPVYKLGAEGGRVAASSGGGVYLLDSGSWRQVRSCRLGAGEQSKQGR